MERSLRRRKQTAQAVYDTEESKPIARRSWMETSCEIMSVIRNGGVRPTHIMYRANVSWKSMKEHLTVLEEHSLVVKAARGGRPYYKLTLKGNQLLDQYLAVKRELLDGKKALA